MLSGVALLPVEYELGHKCTMKSPESIKMIYDVSEVYNGIVSRIINVKTEGSCIHIVEFDISDGKIVMKTRVVYSIKRLEYRIVNSLIDGNVTAITYVKGDQSVNKLMTGFLSQSSMRHNPNITVLSDLLDINTSLGRPLFKISEFNCLFNLGTTYDIIAGGRLVELIVLPSRHYTRVGKKIKRIWSLKDLLSKFDPQPVHGDISEASVYCIDGALVTAYRTKQPHASEVTDMVDLYKVERQEGESSGLISTPEIPSNISLIDMHSRINTVVSDPSDVSSFTDDINESCKSDTVATD